MSLYRQKTSLELALEAQAKAEAALQAERQAELRAAAWEIANARLTKATSEILAAELRAGLATGPDFDRQPVEREARKDGQGNPRSGRVAAAAPDEKPAGPKARSADRHKPGYKVEWQRKARAAKRAKPGET